MANRLRSALLRPSYSAIQRARPDLFSNRGAPIQIVLDEKGRREVEAAQKAQLRSSRMPQEWASTGVVYTDQYLLILRDAVRFPGGWPGTYIRAVNRTSGSVGAAILPLSARGVVLQNHFRHATREWHWEIPRGVAEPGEGASAAAARELEEELGTSHFSLTSIGTVHPDTGITEDRVGLFLAQIYDEPRVDLEEGVRQLKFVTVSELEQLIAEDEVTDSFTIAAFAHARALGAL